MDYKYRNQLINTLADRLEADYEGVLVSRPGKLCRVNYECTAYALYVEFGNHDNEERHKHPELFFSFVSFPIWDHQWNAEFFQRLEAQMRRVIEVYYDTGWAAL